MKKIIALSAAISIIVGAWLYSTLSDNPAQQKPASTIQVSAIKAEKKDVPIQITLVGNIIANETVSIKSRIDSQVTEVTFHDGELVEKGQVLFKLDDNFIKTQLAEQQAKLANAKIQYERAQKLLAGGYVAQSNVDDKKAVYDETKAGVENMRVQLAYATIKSPISGRAGTINATVGNNVKTGDATPLVTINQITPIKAQFSIPERYYESIKNAINDKKNPLQVIANRPETKEKIRGHLEYINNAIDTQNGSFVARAIFTNENEALWPGMFANIEIELGKEKDVIVVPSSVIQGDEGKKFVFRVVDGKAVKTPVVTHNYGDNAIISNGLSEGDSIISDGMLRISDGASVDVKQPQNAESNN